MNKSLTYFIASLLLFGSNGIVASRISLPSYDIVVLRTLLGTALLAAFYLAGRKRRPKSNISLRGFACVAFSGIFMGISWLLLFEAYNLVGVGMSSLLYYCGPVIVMALSPVLFKERLTRTRLAGFATVLAGVALVNSAGLGGGLSPEGLLYSALSAVGLAATILFNKKAENVKGVENALIQLGFAFVAATIGTVTLHGLSMDVPTTDWPAILMLGFVNTGLGCYLYFGNLNQLKAQTVAVCGYIEPVAAVVMATVFLGETMTLLQVVGAVLVVAGAAATELMPLLLSARKRLAARARTYA